MSRIPRPAPARTSPPPSSDDGPTIIDYRRQFPRSIRTAMGPEAASRVFATAYAAAMAAYADRPSAHDTALTAAHEAVEKFLDVLDQDVTPGQSV